MAADKQTTKENMPNKIPNIAELKAKVDAAKRRADELCASLREGAVGSDIEALIERREITAEYLEVTDREDAKQGLREELAQLDEAIELLKSLEHQQNRIDEMEQTQQPIDDKPGTCSKPVISV